MSFSLGNIFHDLQAEIAKVFGGHQVQIQQALTDAQALAGAASIVLAATGQPGAAVEIGKISSGLTAASTAVTAVADSTTLTQQATALATLTTNLVNSGDVNVKNANTQAAIGAVANKVATAVGALETAAIAATPA